MKFKLLKKKNIIPIVIFLFILWMLFFDSNSLLYQLEYNKEIKKLENNIEFYQKEIEKNKKSIKELSDPKKLNNYAREKYHYKKEKEHLYLIEYDTLD